MINEEATFPFRPIQGIIVYQKKNSSNYYLETHDILEEDQKFQWQEGKPFVKEHLQTMALALKETSFQSMEIKGIMPENVLSIKQGFSDVTIVWYMPPSSKTLHFTSDLKIKSGVCKLPGLIFAQKDKDFYVVAYKGKSKPTAETKLFKAPFFNIYEEASVCMGNVKDTKQKFVLHEEIERLENRFFNSKFSHLLDEKVIENKVNLSILFKNLIANKTAFPESSLVPSPYKTVNDFLKKVIK